ncbi:MAG: class I SAM-dependent methyltransferase [Desulfatirhabdiaceae bacterium]
MLEQLKTALAHPLTRHLAIDDPKTTELRAEIIREKRFLRSIYQTWYTLLIDNLAAEDGPVVEIGSGAGFLKEVFPRAVTSEVFFTPHVDMALNAMRMPFKSCSLKTLLLVDTLHHIPDPASFFDEATRCVQPGGRCLMVEPWNTPWSRLIYKHLHHENFDACGGWTIPVSGPLSGANGAMPWILFERDRSLFSERFPEWRISKIAMLMPVVYLLSGGVSLRNSFPGWSYPFFRKLESFWEKRQQAGMFALIRLDRI